METGKKKKFVKTKAGSYVPESLSVTSGDQHSKSLVPESTNKPTTQFPEKKVEPVKTNRELEDEDESIEIPLEISNKRIYMISLTITILIVLATGIVFFLRSKIPAEKITEPVIELSTKETEIEAVNKETPSQKKEEITQLERSEITLEILNGTGVAGAAGKLKTEIEKLGYKNIKVGNSSEVTGSKLYVKDALKAKAVVLIEDAEEKLGIKSVSAGPDDFAADARIVIGK